MKLKLRKFLILVPVIILLASACNSEPKVIISGQVVRVEIAKTAEKQSQGLSGRETLPIDRGMLFVFNNPKQPTFWMKDMKFDLDLIWIKDNKVVEITENAPAEPGKSEAELTLYIPSQEVDMVLEVNGGWAKRHQIPIGAPVDLIP